MQKRILASLLALMLALSVFTPAFATEETEVAPEPVVSAEEVATVEEADALSEEDAQVYTVPILKDREESSEMTSHAVRLMGSNDGPVVWDASTDDFYVNASTFTVKIYISNRKDARQKLKISVVDEDNTTIAEQTGVFYRDSSLVYQMKLLKPVEEYTDYFIQFSYTGKYQIEYDLYDATIWPSPDVTIRDIEVINAVSNSFRIEVSNAIPGTRYILSYQSEYDSDTIIKKTVTVASDNALYVEFGTDIAFSSDNYIYLYDYDSEDEYLDYTPLYHFDIDDSTGEVSNEGVSCNEVISTNDTQTYFYLYQKGFGYQPYEASDASKLNVYLFDMTTGKTVGTKTSVEYDATYGQLDGYLTFNTKLDETHKYIMVFNDGYTLRVYDDFKVTSQPGLSSVNAYDSNKQYLRSLPIGTTAFYTYVNTYNISDRNNVKVELLNSSNKVVATSTYSGSSNWHNMIASSPLAEGKYTLKATYGTLSTTKTIQVGSASSAIWQYAFDQTIYNGKTYIGVALETTTLNPANLTYKVVLEDGTQKTATYHRSLFTEYDTKYFVVVVNEELTSVDYQNEARLEIYQGSTQIVPTYPGNVTFSYCQKESSPFVYSEYNVTATTLEMYLEGFSNVGTFTLCGYDEVTQTGVSVNATRSTNTSVTFNKSDLKKINVMCSLTSGYGGDTELYLENNGEYLFYIWGSTYDGIINAVLDDTFGFQKGFTESAYEVLNLPYKTYAYYKLADSEQGLASKSYQPIEVGILYQLKNLQGKQTVYAQFKTANGVESSVQTASISTDTQAPVFSVSQIPSTFTFGEYGYFDLEFDITTDEAGTLHFEFLDKKGNKIESNYDFSTGVGIGTSSVCYTFRLSAGSFLDATKLVLYMTDGAGNKSEERIFDITVIKAYSTYSAGETFLQLYNPTGTVVLARSTGTSLRIPSEVDGVAVTAIGKNAFDNHSQAIEIFIPDSVTSIDPKAFDDLSDFTLLVKEGSAAHEFAVDNNLTFTIPVVDLGDVNGDTKVNGKDAIAIQRYVLFKTPLDFFEAGDVNTDTKVNGKDAIVIQRFVLFKTPF